MEFDNEHRDVRIDPVRRSLQPLSTEGVKLSSYIGVPRRRNWLRATSTLTIAVRQDFLGPDETYLIVHGFS
jgi:hypothetical protein